MFIELLDSAIKRKEYHEKAMTVWKKNFGRSIVMSQQAIRTWEEFIKRLDNTNEAK